nr:hypothetical protein [Pedobacter sp. L105]
MNGQEHDLRITDSFFFSQFFGVSNYSVGLVPAKVIIDIINIAFCEVGIVFWISCEPENNTKWFNSVVASNRNDFSAKEMEQMKSKIDVSAIFILMFLL